MEAKKNPSGPQVIQLMRAFVGLVDSLAHGQVQRLIGSMNLVHAIANGDVETLRTKFGLRVVHTGPYVTALIRAGFAKAAGMSEGDYAALWPETVIQPSEYVGRFDELLLVDRAVALRNLVELANCELYVRPEECNDLVPPPKDVEGKELKRYIAWVQLGVKNLNRKVEDCCAGLASDEVGLVTAEGLHLSVQHERHLRCWAVDLSGSRCGETNAPCVGWFAGARPELYASHVRGPDPLYGSASRGVQVIPVT